MKIRIYNKIFNANSESEFALKLSIALKNLNSKTPVYIFRDGYWMQCVVDGYKFIHVNRSMNNTQKKNIYRIILNDIKIDDRVNKFIEEIKNDE